MRLNVIETPEVKTFQTNGTDLKFNPKYAGKLTDRQMQCIIAHEVMHCALLHCYRRGNRDNELWNEACDRVINPELSAAGFELWDGAYNDAADKGLSADVVYGRLKNERDQKQDQQPQPQQQPGNQQQQPPAPGNGQQQDQDGQGQGQQQPGGVEDAPNPQGQQQHGNTQQPDPQGMTAEDWKIAAEQATRVSRAAGKMSGGVERALQQSREGKEDWRAILREFIEQTQPSDYSWTNPNRRHIANDVYLPGVIKENLGRIAVAIDTSASLSAHVLELFGGEFTSLVQECRPDSVYVMYCDAAIKHTEEFTADDDITLHPKGGGGTRFNPVFEHIATLDQQPVALLYFTDLECYDKPQEPEYPVLWVTGINVTADGPFGRTIHIDAEV
jgi:predicted metal-dependent peptidase